jgi:hypothetical protein
VSTLVNHVSLLIVIANLIYVSLQIFTVLAAIPDKYQKERIYTIMTCSDRVQAQADVGCGLLMMSKTLYSSRQNQSPYSIEYRDYTNMLERYIEIVKELQKQRAVSNWISEFRSKWNWIDVLLSSKTSRPFNSDITGRKNEGTDITQPSFVLDTTRQYDGHSAANSDSIDSDGNAELNYSDEDDDSRYGPGGSPSTSFDMVTATGAGFNSVNGAYNLHGNHDGVKKFSRHCRVNDREQVFSLYRCRLNDGSRRWYISIVPEHIDPGTNKDIDFYYAPATGLDIELPPTDQWHSISEGRDPPPRLSYTLDEVLVPRHPDYC